MSLWLTKYLAGDETDIFAIRQCSYFNQYYIAGESGRTDILKVHLDGKNMPVNKTDMVTTGWLIWWRTGYTVRDMPEVAGSIPAYVLDVYVCVIGNLYR